MAGMTKEKAQQVVKDLRALGWRKIKIERHPDGGYVVSRTVTVAHLKAKGKKLGKK